MKHEMIPANHDLTGDDMTAERSRISMLLMRGERNRIAPSVDEKDLLAAEEDWREASIAEMVGGERRLSFLSHVCTFGIGAIAAYAAMAWIGWLK